jgi:hypothetical protein
VPTLSWKNGDGRKVSCAAPSHATWQSVNESRYAVLASFFWQSKTDQIGLQDVESFLQQDPRLEY